MCDWFVLHMIVLFICSRNYGIDIHFFDFQVKLGEWLRTNLLMIELLFQTVSHLMLLINLESPFLCLEKKSSLVMVIDIKFN